MSRDTTCGRTRAGRCRSSLLWDRFDSSRAAIDGASRPACPWRLTAHCQFLGCKNAAERLAAVGEAFEENGFIVVESGPNGETDFIVDITGYFAK